MKANYGKYAQKVLKESIPVKELKSRNKEQKLEAQMMLAMVFVLFGVFLSILYPSSVKIPILLFITLMMAASVMLFALSIPALKFFSIGFVTPIEHSSLQRAGSLKSVTLISPDREKSTVYHIFDKGGISVGVFSHVGGGREGYYVIPEGGFIIEGGSVTCLYKPERFKHNQLPEPIKQALLEIPEYKIGCRVYMALFPSTVNVKIIKDAFSDVGTVNSVNDVITMLKMAEEHANLSDSYRRTEMIMGADKISNTVKRYGTKQYREIEDEDDDEKER